MTIGSFRSPFPSYLLMTKTLVHQILCFCLLLLLQIVIVSVFLKKSLIYSNAAMQRSMEVVSSKGMGRASRELFPPTPTFDGSLRLGLSITTIKSFDWT